MFDTIKEIVTWFGVLGIPTIFTMVAWAIRAIKKIRNENREREAKRDTQLEILMGAYQATLRHQLLEDYKRFSQQSYIYTDELEDWLNMYDKYHSLGKNGVMDTRRDQLLNMPVK